MLAPWTQSLALTWRPELSFYEKRFEILRALEERGDLWAFRAHEDRVDGRLFDRWHELSVRQNGATLHLLSPRAAVERSCGALELAVKMIEPARPRQMSVAFQYVAGLPLTFEDAVGRAYGRVLGRFPTSAIHLGDWALLLDLTMKKPAGASGQTEFGLVRAEEVPERLARTVGRAGFGSPRAASPDLWEDNKFPPVAVFMDIHFTADADASTDAHAGLMRFWEGTRDEAGTLIEDIKAKLVADDTNKEVAS